MAERNALHDNAPTVDNGSAQVKAAAAVPLLISGIWITKRALIDVLRATHVGNLVDIEPLPGGDKYLLTLGPAQLREEKDGVRSTQP